MFAYLISYSLEEDFNCLIYPCKEGALGLGVNKVETLLYNVSIFIVPSRLNEKRIVVFEIFSYLLFQRVINSDVIFRVSNLCTCCYFLQWHVLPYSEYGVFL